MPRKLYIPPGRPIDFGMMTSGKLSQNEKSIRYRQAALGAMPLRLGDGEVFELVCNSLPYNE